MAIDDEMLEDEYTRRAVQMVDTGCMAIGSDWIVALSVTQTERAKIHMASPIVFERHARKPDSPFWEDLHGEAAQDKKPQRIARRDPATV
jgi:hypothetical protein